VAAFTPLGQRTSDSVVTADLMRFAARSDVATRLGDFRQVAYVSLARDAYERNDDGAVTALMLGAASRTAAVPRTKRADLWALLDSVQTRDVAPQADPQLVVALEAALVRAQYPILGAPTCAAWETEAARIAAELRAARPPVVVAVAPPSPPAVTPVAAPVPVVTPVITPEAPAELHGIPSMVHFALDQSYLSPASRGVLDVLIDSLSRFPNVTIVLEGHTDLRASVAYNLALSRRRTLSVRTYLESKGVRGERISIVAQGKSHLESDGVGVTDHARNRRVQLRYYAPDGREIEAVQLLDDLQLERARPAARPPGLRRRP
jgi:outer membrane protein OmpA-like peptidoglycan-associated protein